jgi:hypothetical protein
MRSCGLLSALLDRPVDLLVRGALIDAGGIDRLAAPAARAIAGKWLERIGRDGG